MKLILPILLAVLSFAGSLPAAQDPAEAVRQFKESLRTVDRLVLMRTEWDNPKDGDQGKIVLEIKGTEVIATLGDTLEIERFEMHCLCLESPEIHFFQGESYRFSLTLHHNSRLRGEDGALGGDAKLTEQSAERFRAWFVQHGYDRFEKRYEAMLKARVADKIRKEKFLELFPESTRSLFPTEQEQYSLNATIPKAAQFIAQYSDRTALIHDCWRGLGALPRSYDSGWDQEWPDYLRNLLHSLADAEIRVALERLPAEDERVWVGAYRYSELSGARGEERMAALFTDDWLARVAKRAYPLADEYESRSIIGRLGKSPAEATNRFLLEIADSGADKTPARYPKLPNAAGALLVLAKNEVTESRRVIVHQLSQDMNPAVRLALEVALAQFDGPAAIKAAHLQSEFEEVAEMAWQTVSKDPSTQVSIETLAALAAKSASYRVKKEATKKLEVFGLRVMTETEKAASILNEPRFKQAKSLEEIEALIAEIQTKSADRRKDGGEKRLLTVLNHRKGLLLLQGGNYEPAVPLLEGGLGNLDFYADQAFALQTLGRFNNAATSIDLSVDRDDEEAVTRQLVRRGNLAFAEGKFEDAAESFAAAKTINSFSRGEGPISLIQYLSELLAGKNPEAPSIQRMSISDSGFEEFEVPLAEASWPVTASFFIRAKLTESDVFSRIEKQKMGKEKILCEAHFFFSALCRAKGDVEGETRHLQAALDTKAFTTQCFSLATVRFRDLSVAKK